MEHAETHQPLISGSGVRNPDGALKREIRLDWGQRARFDSACGTTPSKAMKSLCWRLPPSSHVVAADARVNINQDAYPDLLEVC